MNPSEIGITQFKEPLPKALKKTMAVDFDSFFESLTRRSTPSCFETFGSAKTSSAHGPFSLEDIKKSKTSLKQLIALSFPEVLHPGKLPVLTKAIGTLVRAQAFSEDHHPFLQCFHDDLPTLSQTYEAIVREKATMDQKLQRFSLLESKLSDVYTFYQKLKTEARESATRKKEIEATIESLQAQMVIAEANSSRIENEIWKLFQSSRPMKQEQEALDADLPNLRAKKAQLDADLEATTKDACEFLHLGLGASKPLMFHFQDACEFLHLGLGAKNGLEHGHCNGSTGFCDENGDETAVMESETSQEVVIVETLPPFQIPPVGGAPAGPSIPARGGRGDTARPRTRGGRTHVGSSSRAPTPDDDDDDDDDESEEEAETESSEEAGDDSDSGSDSDADDDAPGPSSRKRAMADPRARDY
ncbi:hypothetical protein TEA_020693 [Camellia sinensis var. sinensis]|uniref:Uncharacterized protein n=1 Tax=Camellia sinensis var. sinensis TaxID=542762 RepID=A0A4S4DAS2_CAMSN|nr:hypothetical protein TEA_020693 [Camellia sinensis var. sinensis]